MERKLTFEEMYPTFGEQVVGALDPVEPRDKKAVYAQIRAKGQNCPECVLDTLLDHHAKVVWVCGTKLFLRR